MEQHAKILLFKISVEPTKFSFWTWVLDLDYNTMQVYLSFLRFPVNYGFGHIY